MIQTSFFPQPTKDEPIKIIQVNPSGLQPRKVEELLPHLNIQPDTYIIYSTGGYHPFFGVPNTFPIYQLPIWPCVKRIKFSKKWNGKEEILNKIRKNGTRKDHLISQINPYIPQGYPRVNLFKTETYFANSYSHKNKNGNYPPAQKNYKKTAQLFHRLVGLAFIPNPDNEPFVLHNNDDSTNYLIENLKWGGGRENMKKSRARRPDTMEQKYLNLVDKEIIKG
ncbi:MAG: hypothetical protein O3A39_11885 [Proteobacteria bacterium]|nr:hypothetical protein [Pseudomonadota bacterium]